MEEDWFEWTLRDYGLFVNKLWILMSIGAILVILVPALNEVAQHGKQGGANYLSVPKQFFTHFYLLSLLLLMFSNLWDCWQGNFYLIKYLFLGHSLRRLVECIFVFQFGQSRMHLFGYLCGMAHYILVFFTLQISCMERSLLLTAYESAKGSVSDRGIPGALAVAIFFWMNILQYQCHLILARQKQRGLKEDGVVVYRLPNEGMFLYCCCPHYLAEVVLYASLAALESHSLTMMLMTVWVVVNLSIVAYEQYKWYLENDFINMQERKVSILFPFLW